MPASKSPPPPRHLHHSEATRCGETALNTFEERNPDEFSADCGEHCDAFASVQRGAITKAFNVGLKPPQRKELNVDTYNQGCVNPWGCVSNDGVSCLGTPQERFATTGFMHEQFRELNANYDPELSEYAPPSYAMGWKTGTANSVTGWQQAPRSNLFVWQEASPARASCSGPKPQG